MQLDVWTCNCRVYFMALIFQNLYDTQMRNGVKGSKAAVEVMEYSGIKDRADSLKDMVDAEIKAASSIDDAKQQMEISDGERDDTLPDQPPMSGDAVASMFLRVEKPFPLTTRFPDGKALLNFRISEF